MHDIGKVWAYAEGEPTEEGRRLGHEVLGLRELQPLLASALAVGDRDRRVLTTLFFGDWKRSWRHPAAALGDIVRAMDRFSAARSVGNAAARVE